MPHLRRLLCAALATSLFLTTGTAEARFGKHSSSSDDEQQGDKVHDATPVGQDSDSGGSRHSGKHSSRSISVVDTVDTLVSLIALASDISAAAHSYSSPPPVLEQQAVGQQVVEQRPPEANIHGPLLVRMGIEGQSLGEGAAVALNLGLEGQQWGVAGATTSLPLDDGTQGSDKLQLYSAHLTYALYSSDHGRLRAEVGATVAHAPHITFVGPSVALSFEHCLLGALDVESRAHYVPVPFLQLDAQAGLGLHLGVLTLRGGWQWLVLDDQGHLDGEAYRDVVSGPYAGLGLNF